MISREEAAELRELLAAVAAYRAAVVEGTRAVKELLAAGALRDASADARDDEAVKREQGRDLAALLDIDTEYGADWPERRAAALDRERAKHDRVAARLDRWVLADHVRRLVQAGGRGVRQDVAPLLAWEPEGSPTPGGPTRGRVPQQDAHQSASVRRNGQGQTHRQLCFTGTIWIDGAPEPISSLAASWEEAVARLSIDHGSDSAFVLRIEGSTPAAR